ncbi:MAG TPA: hypothetical protein VJJ23_00505 [Candidatus Nanoarchaeia archaeon]|nr:hypothetical protein [Candidatus Nanoarchaeia archaeon]
MEDADFYFKKVENLDKNLIKNLTTGKPSFVENSWQYEIPKFNRIIMVYINSFGEVQINLPDLFNDEFMKEIAKLIKKVYSVLKVSGYGIDEYDGDGDEYEMYPLGTKREQMSRIWSVNLFTQSEVQKYGRGKLLKAPCELIEEWEDDAIFMMIHKDRFSSKLEERQKLRKYLGEDNLPSNFQGKYLNGVYQ